MVEIEFIYCQKKILIQGNLNDKMKDVFLKLSPKIEKTIDQICCLYNGEIINEELTVKKLINLKGTKNTKIRILVNDINKENKVDDNECLKPSKTVICPKCKEMIRIVMHDYKIKLYECKNNHSVDDISFSEYENTQKINEKNIICQNCKSSNKNDSYENIFYVCLSCKINLCPLCKNSHDKNHNIINYEQKDYICNLHYETYNSYCKDCSKNICMLCEAEHDKHNIIYFGKIMPNMKEIEDEINNQKKEIKNFINDIEEIIDRLNDLINNVEIYYKIYDDIIHNYNIKNKNHIILQNIKDIRDYNHKFLNNINTINNEKNIINKFKSLIDISHKMNSKNKNKKINESIKEEVNNKDDENVIKETELIMPKNGDEKEEKIEKKKEEVKNSEKLDKNDSNLIKISGNLNEQKEQILDNYDSVKISQMIELCNIEIKNGFLSFLLLEDGRIAMLGHKKNILYIINLKDNKCDINSYLGKVDTDYKGKLFQMDDGNLIVARNYDIQIIKLKDKEIEIIYSKHLQYDTKFFKFSKEIIIYKFDYAFYFYRYNNGNINLEESVYKDFDSNDIIENSLYNINEKELVLIINKNGILRNTDYVVVYNVEKGKIIKSIKLGRRSDHLHKFCLIDKNNLLVSHEETIILLDLQKYNIKDNYHLYGFCYSITSLNENSFLIIYESKYGGNYISHYYINNDEIIYRNRKKIDYNFPLYIEKYNDNKLIGDTYEQLHIYGFKKI